MKLYTEEQVRWMVANVINLGLPIDWLLLQQQPIEYPQLGTKEFNDMASAYFGGNPQKKTIEQAQETIKQQIIDAYKAGEKNMRETFSCSGYKNVSAEDYYNERVR